MKQNKQNKAKRLVRNALRGRNGAILSFMHDPEEETKCTGNIKTCPVDECMICGVRECPYNEPLHFHHDGCPACWAHEKHDR